MAQQKHRKMGRYELMRRCAVFLALLFVMCTLLSSNLKPGITLDIETDTPLDLSVYYYAGTESGYPYDEDHKSSNYSLQTERQTVNIPLGRANMRYIRVDFGTVPAKVVIYRIELRCSPFERYVLEGSEIARIFSGQNCISSTWIDGEAVTYVTTGIDGFVAAQSDLFSLINKPAVPFRVLGLWCGMVLLAILASFTSIFSWAFKYLSLWLKNVVLSFREKDARLKKRFLHFHQYVICTVCSLVCMALLWEGPEYIFLNLAYTFGLGLCISVLWENATALRKAGWQDLAVLSALAAVVTLPLMLTTFYYGDDYWSFKQASTGYDYAGAIAFRRPLLGPMGQILRYLDYRVLHLRRAATVLILILCVISVYELVLRCHKSRKCAFSVSLLFGAGTFMIDSVAYISTAPIFFSILFSLCAFEYYERAQREGRWNYFLFALLLICGFCLYQIATPVLFVAFLITLYNNNECESQQFKNAFKILVFYGVIAVGYLLSTKWLMSFYQISAVQEQRSQISFEPSFYIEKIKWFLQTVIPQSIYKIWAVFLGKGSFTTNNLFYLIKIESQLLGNLVTVLTLVCTSVYLLRFLLHRRYATLFVALVGIPLSFYPFLILPESIALSYYMIPLMLLLIYYSVSGFWILWNAAAAHWPAVKNISGRILTAGCAVLIVISAANGSAYSNNWVNFSRDSYMFLKQSIAHELNEDTKTIMVFGTLGPYVGGNPYVIFAVQRVLNEMEKDYTQYHILQADEAEYIAVVPEATMVDVIQQRLTPKEFERFQSFYAFDTMYRQYNFTHSASEEELGFLQQCLQKAGLLVLEPSDTEIVISLEGFAGTHAW